MRGRSEPFRALAEETSVCMSNVEWVLDGKAEGVGWKILWRSSDSLNSWFLSGKWQEGKWLEASLGSPTHMRTLPREQGFSPCWVDVYGGQVGYKLNSELIFHTHPELAMPQGIYVFPEKPVVNSVSWDSQVQGSRHASLVKVKWEGLLAKGIDGPRGFNTRDKNITVVRAMIIGYEH